MFLIFKLEKNSRGDVIVDLNFEITNQIIERLDKNVLVNKSQNYVKCCFNFITSDWDDLEKFAIFKDAWGHSYISSLGPTKTCECHVPNDALKGTNFKVSVYGGDLITSNELIILLIPSGYTTNISLPKEHGKDIFVELFEKIESKIDNIIYENNNLCCFSGDDLLLNIPLILSYNDLVDVPNCFTPEDHSHEISDITDFENNVDIDLDKLLTSLTENIRMI